MLRNLSKLIMSPITLRQFSTNSEIPKEFGKNLSDLFRQAKYSDLIRAIESSKFSSNPDLLKLKSLSYELLSEEDAVKAQISLKQAAFFSKEQESIAKSNIGI